MLPPLLAFLDDSSAPNKLVGTTLLDALLEHVDASLLVRTGVGKVFEKVSARRVLLCLASRLAVR